MKVKIKKLHEDAIIPKYATDGSAGFDIHCIENVLIDTKEAKLIRTGLSFEIPKGYEMQIRPRSGLAINFGITVLNSPGTIDSDYRGEVKIIIHNTSDKIFAMSEGAKIAQGVICKVDQAEFEEVDELSETERGIGGFGSTGV